MLFLLLLNLCEVITSEKLEAPPPPPMDPND